MEFKVFLACLAENWTKLVFLKLRFSKFVKNLQVNLRKVTDFGIYAVDMFLVTVNIIIWYILHGDWSSVMPIMYLNFSVYVSNTDQSVQYFSKCTQIGVRT